MLLLGLWAPGCLAAQDCRPLLPSPRFDPQPEELLLVSPVAVSVPFQARVAAWWRRRGPESLHASDWHDPNQELPLLQVLRLLRFAFRPTLPTASPVERTKYFRCSAAAHGPAVPKLFQAALTHQKVSRESVVTAALLLPSFAVVLAGPERLVLFSCSQPTREAPNSTLALFSTPYVT